MSTGVLVRVAAAPPPPPPPPSQDDLTGVALDASGRPIANAIVQVQMVWNPNVVRTRTGADGRYAVRGLPAGLSHKVIAWHEVSFAGRSYCVRLGMPNVGDYDAFVPGAGVVRDFRWKLTGRIPDAGNNYFGATLVLVPATNFYDPVLEHGDDVELTLVPQGPLVDGSAGEVITRTVRYNTAGWNSRLEDIPHGVYTARVTRVRGGVRTALRVARLDNGTPGATATVDWEPDHQGSCGQVLGPDLRTFSLRLENP
ncbi:MAG: carboxypeptidase regulatory-like domain-containing protein [Gemmatimonadaceae bacterium]|nr:carboxypeptidase regulatory-like domain-containing protein [Gemmatimonadaceae bacterium]